MSGFFPFGSGPSPMGGGRNPMAACRCEESGCSHRHGYNVPSLFDGDDRDDEILDSELNLTDVPGGWMSTDGKFFGNYKQARRHQVKIDDILGGGFGGGHFVGWVGFHNCWAMHMQWMQQWQYMVWMQWQQQILGMQLGFAERREMLITMIMQTQQVTTRTQAEQMATQMLGMERGLGANEYGVVSEVTTTTTTTTNTQGGQQQIQAAAKTIPSSSGVTQAQRWEAANIFIDSCSRNQIDMATVETVIQQIRSGQRDDLVRKQLAKQSTNTVTQRAPAPPPPQPVQQATGYQYTQQTQQTTTSPPPVPIVSPPPQPQYVQQVQHHMLPPSVQSANYASSMQLVREGVRPEQYEARLPPQPAAEALYGGQYVVHQQVETTTTSSSSNAQQAQYAQNQGHQHVPSPPPLQSPPPMQQIEGQMGQLQITQEPHNPLPVANYNQQSQYQQSYQATPQPVAYDYNQQQPSSQWQAQPPSQYQTPGPQGYQQQPQSQYQTPISQGYPPPAQPQPYTTYQGYQQPGMTPQTTFPVAQEETPKKKSKKKKKKKDKSTA